MKPERMLELEEMLKNVNIGDLSIKDLINLQFNFQDISYLLRAILIPIDDIIAYSDSEVSNDLLKKYNTDFETFIKRMREAKAIKDYQAIESKVTR